MGDITTCAVVKSSAARLRMSAVGKGMLEMHAWMLLAGYLGYELLGSSDTSLRPRKFLKIKVFADAKKSQDIEPKVKRTDVSLSRAKQRFTDC